MKYYGLPLRPMQESGAFLLRAMQNEDMPRLDLLVRESVQNALDAALDREPGGNVSISFMLREHATETVASILAEGIDRKVLLARRPDGGRMLEIRDSLTEGLTGPTSFDAIGRDGVHGNLLKLVYEIGRTRGDAGAGGSWGLGKTCYFRMGVGLVFYYSRIKLGEGYEERLVASLVEDETNPDRMQRDTQTGIGWWGAEEGLKPLTGPMQIKRILELLRMERFTGTETGTSIVIPFLRDGLLEPPESDDAVRAAYRPWWYDSHEEYIRVALERWFCARLDNPHFATGPSLAASVNGKHIAAEKMLPVFRAAQALYNRATGAQVGAGDYLTEQGIPVEMITNQQVKPRGLFMSSGHAGDVAAALLTPEQLGTGAPFNHPDPAMCVFGRSDAKPPFHPLVTFMRRPGMCVAWEDSTESRGWAGGMPGVADGRYLVAVFVPRQERVLANAGRRNRDDTPVTLESYLRSCERADHAAWHDAAGLRVVEKIRLNCGRILHDFGTRQLPAATAAHSIRMARNLADLVLPERGMGTDGRAGRPSPTRPGRNGKGGGIGGGGAGGGGAGGGGAGRRGPAVSETPVLDLLGVDYTAQGLQVRWALEWGSTDRQAPRKISLKVDSEGGPISLQQWRSDGLGTFPFRICDAKIEPEAEQSGDISVEIDDDCEDGVVFRIAGNGPASALAGVLLIGLTSGEPGVLRPVLSASLVESVAEGA